MTAGFLAPFFATIFVFASGLFAQTDRAADASVYAVSYVNLQPSSRATATAALKTYRDASRADPGHLRIEIFEQIGRPGHFVIVETWKDQKAIDGQLTSDRTKQLYASLDPIRLSGYDRRLYKPLNIASPNASGGSAIYVVSHLDILPSAPQADVVGNLERLGAASRMEAGNLRFDVLRSAARPNHFTLVEAWRNQSSLDAHAAAPHTKKYRDMFNDLTGSPIDERLFKTVG